MTEKWKLIDRASTHVTSVEKQINDAVVQGFKVYEITNATVFMKK